MVITLLFPVPSHIASASIFATGRFFPPYSTHNKRKVWRVGDGRLGE